MDPETFARHGHALVDWIARYLAEVERYPVRSAVRPGEVLSGLSAAAPEKPEPFEALFDDFERVILPGITHWNHPSFFAYFPANHSAPSILGELLASGLGAQCMSWETSPAAAELEQRMMEWLRDLLGLPAAWTGVIQDTASTATLIAMITARERATAWQSSARGLGVSGPPLVAYTSAEAHSSVRKNARIAGYGDEGVRLVAVDGAFAMRPDALEEAIAGDVARGRRPACVVATLGTTSITAFDPLEPVGAICARYGVWLHVDAAMAGSAAILPEMRWMLRGIERADSFAFNPHKWLFTNFDCSAYFVADPASLVRTFGMQAEYLKTGVDAEVRNYRDWGIQLGRRFRALKLWFVLRSFGAEGLRARLREHLRLARAFAGWVDEDPDFERLAPAPVNLVCFRCRPGAGRTGDPRDEPQAGDQPPVGDAVRLDALNERLHRALNESGALYLTHTRVRGAYAIRMSIGQTGTEERHVRAAWDRIRHEARRLAAVA